VEQVALPELGIELVETTYFKGSKERKVRPDQLPGNDDKNLL